MLKKIALSAAVAASALATLPSAALAQDRYGYHDRYDRGYQGRAYRDNGRYDRRYSQRYDDRRYDNYYGRRCSNGSTGTIIGAIAGGLLGRELAGRGDRAAGTIIGGAAGALAGRSIDRDCRR